MTRQQEGTTTRRLEALERTVDTLRGLYQTLLQTPRVQRPRNVRFCITRGTEETPYPSIVGHPNVYPMVFLDGTYDDSMPGRVTAELDDRTEQPAAFVYSIFDEWIPPDTVCQIWWENEKWWTDWSPDRQDIVRVTSDVPDSFGYYPAVVERFDVNTESWVIVNPCRVLDLNA